MRGIDVYILKCMKKRKKKCCVRVLQTGAGERCVKITEGERRNTEHRKMVGCYKRKETNYHKIPISVPVIKYAVSSNI